MSGSDDYEVGYGRPPKHSRFKPGQSPNPKGRPKGSRSMSDEIDRMLRRKVPLKVGGRTREASVFEATLLQLGHQAVKGSLKAAEILLRLAQQRASEATGDVETGLTPADFEILQQYEKIVLDRHAASRRGATPGKKSSRRKQP